MTWTRSSTLGVGAVKIIDLGNDDDDDDDVLFNKNLLSPLVPDKHTSIHVEPVSLQVALAPWVPLPHLYYYNCAIIISIIITTIITTIIIII